MKNVDHVEEPRPWRNETHRATFKRERPCARISLTLRRPKRKQTRARARARAEQIEIMPVAESFARIARANSSTALVRFSRMTHLSRSRMLIFIVELVSLVDSRFSIDSIDSIDRAVLFNQTIARDSHRVLLYFRCSVETRNRESNIFTAIRRRRLTRLNRVGRTNGRMDGRTFEYFPSGRFLLAFFAASIEL